MRTQTLFQAGALGYASYRIPSMLTLPGGRVLAFCEGRVASSSDTGEIHILLRIGDGASFRAQKVVAKDGQNTVGNPTPVYDALTGRLWLLLTGNAHDAHEWQILKNQADRRVFAMYSDDLGETWSRRRDITRQVKAEGWTWYATGPCHAIQLASGRLAIPCNHGVFNADTGESSGYISHVVLSDDHGKHWRAGGSASLHTNECSIAQLQSGEIYLNMRSYRGEGCRAFALSEDQGESFGETRPDPGLPEPVCQGSVLAHDGWLFFVNPASRTARENLTLRMKPERSSVWTHALTLVPGSAGYADLAILPSGRVGCLLECEDYARIDLISVSIGEIPPAP